jgi:hypothetical protein
MGTVRCVCSMSLFLVTSACTCLRKFGSLVFQRKVKNAPGESLSEPAFVGSSHRNFVLLYIAQAVAVWIAMAGAGDAGFPSSMWCTFLSICLLCNLVGSAADLFEPTREASCFVPSSPRVPRLPGAYLRDRSHRNRCCSWRDFLRHGLRKKAGTNGQKRALTVQNVMSGDPLNTYFSGEQFRPREWTADSDSLGEAGAGARRQAQGQSTSKVLEDSDFYDRDWKTPLWMVSQEPDLNNLVKYLQLKKGGRERIMEWMCHC